VHFLKVYKYVKKTVMKVNRIYFRILYFPQIAYSWNLCSI